MRKLHLFGLEKMLTVRYFEATKLGLNSFQVVLSFYFDLFWVLFKFLWSRYFACITHQIHLNVYMCLRENKKLKRSYKNT
jgi:hypothetical protein